MEVWLAAEVQERESKGGASKVRQQFLQNRRAILDSHGFNGQMVVIPLRRPGHYLSGL